MPRATRRTQRAASMLGACGTKCSEPPPSSSIPFARETIPHSLSLPVNNSPRKKKPPKYLSVPHNRGPLLQILNPWHFPFMDPVETANQRSARRCTGAGRRYSGAMRWWRGEAGAWSAGSSSRSSAVAVQRSQGAMEIIRRRDVREFAGAMAASEMDYCPSRMAVVAKHAEVFIREFFDQNPLSHVGLVTIKDGISHRLTDIGGSPESQIKALMGKLECFGDSSLQNALELVHGYLDQIQSYGHKEVLILYSALNTCVPGDIMETIGKCKKNPKLDAPLLVLLQRSSFANISVKRLVDPTRLRWMSLILKNCCWNMLLHRLQ